MFSGLVQYAAFYFFDGAGAFLVGALALYFGPLGPFLWFGVLDQAIGLMETKKTRGKSIAFQQFGVGTKHNKTNKESAQKSQLTLEIQNTGHLPEEKPKTQQIKTKSIDTKKRKTSTLRESEMVSKTEETQLNRLENQVDNGGGGAWEYLCLVRKLKVRRSEKVLKHGLAILNVPKQRSALGPEG